MCSPQQRPTFSVDEKETFPAISTLEGASPSTHEIHDVIPIDRSAEKRLLRKLDLLIIPMLMAGELLTFLDRTNIGNARIQGMEEELGLTGNQFQIAVSVFYAGFAVAEIPANLIMKKVGPSLWMSMTIFTWGVITICTGLVKGYKGLVACRIFLGVFDGCFIPAAILLMSTYYTRYEFGSRFYLMFTSSAIAGAFGGLIAYACAHLDGRAGLSGWRWLYVIEGLVMIAFVIPFKVLIPDWPDKTHYLDANERALVQARSANSIDYFPMDRLDKHAWKRILKDWKIYAIILNMWPTTLVAISLGIFVPTLLKSLSWSPLRVQYTSIPIWLLTFLFSTLTAYISDRLHHRFLFMIYGCLLSIIGFIILLVSNSIPARYFALYLAGIGTFTTLPMCTAWLMNNLSGHYKRSVGAALIWQFGSAGSAAGSFIYPPEQAPGYVMGYAICIGALSVTMVVSTGIMLGLWWENRMREKGRRDGRLSWVGAGNLGDDDPRFRYVY